MKSPNDCEHKTNDIMIAVTSIQTNIEELCQSQSNAKNSREEQEIVV